MRGWVWRFYLGAGALATGGYYLLSYGAGAVLNVVVGASAVAAIAAGIRWHRPPRRAAWWLIAAAQGLFVAGDALSGAGVVVRVSFDLPSAA
jgi:diguanylate cyclase